MKTLKFIFPETSFIRLLEIIVPYGRKMKQIDTFLTEGFSDSSFTFKLNRDKYIYNIQVKRLFGKSNYQITFMIFSPKDFALLDSISVNCHETTTGKMVDLISGYSVKNRNVFFNEIRQIISNRKMNWISWILYNIFK